MKHNLARLYTWRRSVVSSVPSNRKWHSSPQSAEPAECNDSHKEFKLLTLCSLAPTRSIEQTFFQSHVLSESISVLISPLLSWVWFWVNSICSQLALHPAQFKLASKSNRQNWASPSSSQLSIRGNPARPDPRQASSCAWILELEFELLSLGLAERSRAHQSRNRDLLKLNVKQWKKTRTLKPTDAVRGVEVEWPNESAMHVAVIPRKHVSLLFCFVTLSLII